MKLRYWIAIYLIGFIITYGYTQHEEEKLCKLKSIEWQTKHPNSRLTPFCLQESFLKSEFWPIYWPKRLVMVIIEYIEKS